MKTPHLIPFLLPLVLAACSSAVTPARLDAIAEGMKTEQVIAQLGQPTRIDHAEITGLTGDVYHYISSGGDARIVFVNGSVFNTQFVSSP